VASLLTRSGDASLGRIKPPVDQGCQRQEVFGVFFAHSPKNSGFVRTGIPEHPERAFDQVREAALLTALALAGKRVDCKQR
jgi:hypothetical protein